MVILTCVLGCYSDDDVRVNIVDSELKHSEHIEIIGREFAHLVLIVTNYVDPDTGVVNDKLSYHLHNLIGSILRFSTGHPLHFILITDEASSEEVGQEIVKIVGKSLSERVIRKKLEPKLQFPKFKFELVNLEPIVAKLRQYLEVMKELFGQEDHEPIVLNPGDDLYEKYVMEDMEENVAIEIVPFLGYNQDFYYIAPFYHVIFPGLEEMVALDLDLEFR